MRYDEFVNDVQGQVGLDSRVEAERVIEATLETLGELLSKKEVSDLAAELPKPMKGQLRKRRAVAQGADRPRRFSLEEFYNRVAARSDVRYPAAVRRSNAVMKIVGQAVSRGELADVFAELGDDYDELLRARPKGPLSPTKTQ